LVCSPSRLGSRQVAPSTVRVRVHTVSAPGDRLPPRKRSPGGEHGKAREVEAVAGHVACRIAWQTIPANVRSNGINRARRRDTNAPLECCASLAVAPHSTRSAIDKRRWDLIERGVVFQGKSWPLGRKRATGPARPTYCCRILAILGIFAASTRFNHDRSRVMNHQQSPSRKSECRAHRLVVRREAMGRKPSYEVTTP
jgi:hypothetical protein